MRVEGDGARGTSRGSSRGRPAGGAPNSARRPTGARCQEAEQAAAVVNWDEQRREWCLEAFQALVREGSETLSARRLQGSAFAGWLRALLSDMVSSGVLPPSKAVRTSRIIALLAARAGSGDGSGLTSQEFVAFTRVIMRPSPGCLLEEEIAWALLDVDRHGAVPISCFDEARRLWESLGVFCAAEDAEEVLQTAKFEDDGMLTAQRYHEVFVANCCERASRPNQGRPMTSDWEGSRSGLRGQSRGCSSAPASARGCSRASAEEGNASLQQPYMHFRAPLRAQDQNLRSQEVADLSLSSKRQEEEKVLRPLTPSRPSRTKRPGRQGREDVAYGVKHEDQVMGIPKLPKVTMKPRVEICWELQEECWQTRQARLHPFQRVEVQYVGKRGEEVKAVGTLLGGWGVPNTAVKVPHSHSRRPPNGKQKDSPRHMDTTEVVVEVNGIEKVVPRECVKPLDKSGK